MSKMNELSQTVDELKSAANLLLSVADSLLDLFSGTGEPQKKRKKLKSNLRQLKKSLPSNRLELF